MPDDQPKTSRTGSIEALEILAWHLNFFPEEELSINEISRSTGLAWATVKKFSEAMELINNISPTMVNTKNGIKISSRARIFEEIFTDDLRTAAFYLFLTAKASGKVTNKIMLEKHDRFKSRYEASIQKLIDLDLLKQTDDGVRLSAAGIALSSDMYSWINEKMLQIHSEPSFTQFTQTQGTYSLSTGTTFANGLENQIALGSMVTTYCSASGTLFSNCSGTQQVTTPPGKDQLPCNTQPIGLASPEG
jgi:hypothetical protein